MPVLPSEDNPVYRKFKEVGLIDQIKANLDTEKQFAQNRLSFEKWNNFDPNLYGETFTVKSDPETEYKNIRFNIVNIFQDALWDQMSLAETQKLMDHLSNKGYTIFNNRIFRGGQEIADSELEAFADTVINYVENSNYFKNHIDSNGRAISSTEIDGADGFSDHIKDFKHHIDSVKKSRTVKDIHFRLSDDSDIGRNIFFGNHVGCCNSIEASYAGYSAPMHLMNAYNRGVELVDKYGNSYGNSLCFFANIDGKLTFVIDSFEANGKLSSNPMVPQMLVKFAKQVCAEMGRPDTQIAIGPSNNNMEMSMFKISGEHSIKVVGSISTNTYCDTAGGHVTDEINRTLENRYIYYPIQSSAS